MLIWLFSFFVQIWQKLSQNKMLTCKYQSILHFNM